MVTRGIAVEMPPPLPPPATGDAALDDAVTTVLSTYRAGGLPDVDALTGAGSRLQGAWTAALCMTGSVRWDEDEARSLSPAALAARKAEANARYVERNARLGLWTVLVEALGRDDAGRACRRRGLEFGGDPEMQKRLLAALVAQGDPADLRAVAQHYDDAGDQPSPWGLAARLRLDPDYGPALAARASTGEPALVASALWALHATGMPPALVWEPILIGALEDAALTVVAQKQLRALPRGPERLDALLRAQDGPGLADLLVDFDDVAALDRLAHIVTTTTRADNAARLALRPSRHAHAAVVCAKIVDALRASGQPNARVQPFVKLAAELATKHGVVAAKKGRAKPAAAPAPAPAPATTTTTTTTEPASASVKKRTPSQRATKPTPVAVEGDDAFATLTRALHDAGVPPDVVAHVLSPAVELLVDGEAARQGDDAVGPITTRFGGAPDLPRSARWPVHAGVPMTFVAQLRLDELAGHGVAPPLPTAGLLSFFVVTTVDDYAAVGAVLFTRRLAGLAPKTPPVGVVPYAARRPRLRRTAQLASTTHPQAARAGAGFAAVRKGWAHVDGSAVLGFRPGWDGDCPPGHRRLLAVASDAAPGLAFGDEQVLEFLIDEASLAAARFERVTVRLGE